MKCRDCDEANEEGYRYCFNCGAYLAVKPGPAHWDLLQLSRMDFLTTVAEGLPLIWENSARLWRESVDLRQLGPSQSVGILQSFAEEEAAKVLILLDAVRCPASSKNEFGRLVKQLDQHVGKGIYVRYYGTSPSDMTEVKRIVEVERQGFSREGEYGEFILPNSITTSRESRLYVSYVRNDDGTHEWHIPYKPLHFEGLGSSGIIRVVEALHAAGVFEVESLKAFREYWESIPFVDIGDNPVNLDRETSIGWRQLTDLNLGMLKELDQRGVLSPAATVEHQRTLVQQLLFPLYPFDLSIRENFRDLPPPDSPYSY